MTALVPLSVPAEGPVTLDALRTYLRIDGTDDDALLAPVLLAARQHIAQRCGRILAVESWRMRLDAWPEGQRVQIPLVPFRRVLAARVYDATGVAADIPASAIVASVPSEPAYALFSGAPAPGLPQGGIEIDFEAGYESAADVPAALTLAVLRMAARLYETRGDEQSAMRDDTLDALIAPYRIARLA